MSTSVKLNALLSLPEDFSEELIEGNSYTILKDGYRIMPFNMPMELSTHDHKYLAKVVVEELRTNSEGTFVTFRVIKLFSPEESKTFSDNFIRL